MVPTKHSSPFSTSELWATPEGFPWQKWGLLFSIMDLRSGFSLVELIMVFKMCGLTKCFPKLPSLAGMRMLQALPPSPFHIGLET